MAHKVLLGPAQSSLGGIMTMGLGLGVGELRLLDPEDYTRESCGLRQVTKKSSRP